ncbi:MAG: ATP-binding protein [Rudaea sp.]
MTIENETSSAKPYGASTDRQFGFQLCIECLPEAYVALADSGAVLFANAAARALLAVTDSAQFAASAQSWFYASRLAMVAADGLLSFDHEHHLPPSATIWLRIRLHSFATENAPAIRYLALIQTLQTDTVALTALAERQRELEQAQTRLHDAQDQLLQSEKMASIGLLAAGVAHEINNPIGFTYSNLGTLKGYVDNLFQLIDQYESILRPIRTERPEYGKTIEDLKLRIDYPYLVNDMPALLSESREGLERVRKIVEALRDFSRAGYSEEWALADLHRGLDSTLNIVWNDLKYKCELHKQYGEIPQIVCLASQMNQVFLNILVNAGHAIEKHGTITIATGRVGDDVFVDISDDGKGIAPENLGRIFDPFFTTKIIGEGTGLGLSLSYGIVRKHGGRIEVQSQVGVGTTFRVILPVLQPQRDDKLATQ